ncbi:MAG: hypothetical protein Q7U02_14450 [Desulfosalsimonadaceae bacterium]|nr:hypothetical protein [Desulfosalsimonadaceae bacterium]
MKKIIFTISFLLLISVFLAGSAAAATEDRATQITKDVLSGPGSIEIKTDKEVLMSFGARTRLIPVSETDFDFGIEDDLKPPFALLGGALDPGFFKVHANESGWINNNNIRNETQLYFNALPETRAWSFYTALEFDRPLDNSSADERGGRDYKTSNFGLERVHGTFKLPMNMRLHGGIDIWGTDIIDAGGLVYGDDNPGFWVTGDYDTFSFSAGYFKMYDKNWGTAENINTLGGKNSDRDLYAGYMTFKPAEGQKFQPFYVFDQIRSVQVGTFLDYVMKKPGAIPETDSHHLGAYYTGNFGMLEVFLEGVYQFGQADNTGLVQNDFDISAHAFSADLALKLDDAAGFGVKPHIGVLYTSGDDDPNDDTLGGYCGVTNAQRFSQYFGGENTIIGDTNFVLGSVLYGYLPELYGNGTPVFTGGLQNFAGSGNGRGDNPGLSMTSVGITLTPKIFLIFRSNVNSFWWNEDILVTSFANPAISTPVESGYTGTEWDNEITLATSKNSFIKTHFSFFFPGETIEDVSSALTTLAPTLPGEQSDEMATRLGMEFIWMF